MTIVTRLPGNLPAGDKSAFGGAYPIHPGNTGFNNVEVATYPAATTDLIVPVVSPVDPNKIAIRWECRAGSGQPHYGSAGERSEGWWEPHNRGDGSEDAVCTSFWIPPDFYAGEGWFTPFQVHAADGWEADPNYDGDPSPPYALGLFNGQVTFQQKYVASHQFGPVLKGHELFVQWYLRHSKTNGEAKLWLKWDSPPAADEAPWKQWGGQTHWGGNQYYKTGIYRGKTKAGTSVIYSTAWAFDDAGSLAAARAEVGWGATQPPPPPPPPPPVDWKLTFEEEFDSSPLARGWQPTFAYGGNPAGHTKGDPEVATETNDSWVSDASGVSIANGVCTFTLRKGPGKDEITGKSFPYKTGLLQSGGIYDYTKYPQIVMLKPVLFAQKYGRFEAEIRGPSAPGTGLGWWLLPTTYHEATQADGEIDIMESIANSPAIGHFAIHRGYTPGRHFEAQTAIEDSASGFHTYAVEWEPDMVRWYVDGVEEARCTDASLIPSVPMYMTIGLGSGGGSDGWLGAVDESKLPATMQVRSIRVYQRSSVMPGTIGGSIKNGDVLKGTVVWTADSGPCDFTIDGKLPWHENNAPFVYNGDGGSLDTKALADGTHTFKVAMTDGSSAQTVVATVANVVAPPPLTNAELRDQAVAALKATTVAYPAWKAKLDAGGYPDPKATKWQQAFDLLARIK